LGVPTELSEDDSRAYGVVQAFSLFLAAGTLYAAYLMTRQAAPVFLGQVADPYDRVVWVGVGVGIPTALCGAVIAMMAAQQRRWDFLRIAATTLLIGNLGIPLTWGVLWLMRQGYLPL
jgi:MFS family permease